MPTTKTCKRGHPATPQNRYVEPGSLRWRCLQCHRENASKYRMKKCQESKTEALAHYGKGRCSCCGERDARFLTIDHVDGKGSEHRRRIGRKGRGSNFYVWLRDNGFPKGFRVLCFNCNCGRSVNGGVCPHKDNYGGEYK